MMAKYARYSKTKMTTKLFIQTLFIVKKTILNRLQNTNSQLEYL